jgi:mono/diheme cytochrome c family protein
MRINAAITFATLSAALLASVASVPVAAQLSPSAQRGRTFVQANCSHCHAVDKVSASPLPIAPALRTLHRKYPVENLQEALAEGIRTGHPNMPAFRLDPGQISDVIAYLKTLEP